jgi:LAO/AO transport system kinase
MDVDGIFEGILRKERARLARAISLVEDEAPGAAELLSLAYRHRKGAMVTGITGAPGVGKSTMVDSLVSQLLARGKSVGVIAVDPSSPFTGGAILGDRVRMRSQHSTHSQVFFRSLASRGHLGGVSRHTGDVIALLDAYGFDHILVETVGAGQSEVDIMKYAHTVVVALAPGLGDDIQAIKAGIMEIGDVFCVNKADLPGADRTQREIEMMLAMKDSFNGNEGDGQPPSWQPPVIKAIAASAEQTGISDLADAVLSHHEYLRESQLLRSKNLRGYRAVLEEYLRLLTVQAITDAAEAEGSMDKALDDLLEGRLGPLEAAQRLVSRFAPRPQ